MTGKRYIVDVDEAIIDTKINREYTTWDISGVEDICDKLNNLTEENEQLKQRINKLESQLYCPFDSICIQCNNEYLVQTEKYYVSKCKKGHEQCSKVDVKYCDDFELKGDVE